MKGRSSAVLPLHYGRAPKWLFRDGGPRRLHSGVHEYGVGGLLERLSDPWFFQSLRCVLG